MGNIAGMIDHTLLKAAATSADIKKICAECNVTIDVEEDYFIHCLLG